MERVNSVWILFGTVECVCRHVFNNTRVEVSQQISFVCLFRRTFMQMNGSCDPSLDVKRKTKYGMSMNTLVWNKQEAISFNMTNILLSIWVISVRVRKWSWIIDSSEITLRRVIVVKVLKQSCDLNSSKMLRKCCIGSTCIVKNITCYQP